MAVSRSRAQIPVGSAQWAAEEKTQAAQFVEQEVEEFSYSVRNELEWLNEHMAEIFSRDQFNVVDIFKTPGKLRGKTPRTARKRNAFESRQPLTDVFTSANDVKASPAQRSQFQKQISHFKLAEDTANHVIDPPARFRFSSGAGKENTDLEQHGIVEEEKEADYRKAIPYDSAKPDWIQHNPSHEQRPILEPRIPPREERQASPGSFVSAREAQSSKSESNIEMQVGTEEFAETSGSTDATQQKAQIDANSSSSSAEHSNVEIEIDDNLEAMDEDGTQLAQNAEDVHLDSSSEDPTPDRSMMRKKSSLNFASLPAREPLTSKKSVGPTRTSTHTHHTHAARSSSVANTVSAMQEQHPSNSAIPELSQQQTLDSHEDESDDFVQRPGSQTKLHSVTSTQRLHERITMLGKMNPTRTSKSIASNALNPHSVQVDPNVRPELNVTAEDPALVEDDAADAPPKSTATSQLSQQPTAVPTAILPEEVVQDNSKLPVESKSEVLKGSEAPKAVHNVVSFHSPISKPIERLMTSISYPKLAVEEESTTPLGSPTRSKNTEGPLSASKAKLYSVFQSAKGIFASSAGVSAQAKMEALSPRLAKRNQPTEEALKSYETNLMKSSITYPALKQPVAEIVKSIDNAESAKNTPVKAKRRSSERHKYTRNAQHIESESHNNIAHEPIRIHEDKMEDIQYGKDEKSQNATGEASQSNQQGLSDMTKHDSVETKVETLPVSTQQSGTTAQKTTEMKRPIRPPPKEQGPKSRPAPVSIRVASQKIGQIAPANNNFGASTNDATNPENAARPPALNKKASSSSIHTVSSTQSFKGTASASTGRPKALEAAARKREQDEREAQRKAEQKREIERRRAAKAEEEKRAAEEQKAAEQQKALEARNALQKQAERRAEVARKAEQQRVQQALNKSRNAESDNPFKADRSQGPSNHPRADLGSVRPVSRMGNLQDDGRTVPHMNPAKPPKRHWNPDADDEHSQQSAIINGQANVAPQSKRRRTSEDEFVETISRPKMAPPVRLSKVAKDIPNKFTHGYMSNAASSHQSASMMKTTVMSQHQAQQSQQHPKTPHMNDLAKYTSGKIPFAEHPNPPQSAYTRASQPRTHMQNLKTPGTASRHKSSPQYPNGENIELPDIATDSEDSDEDEFVPPDWANSPALRELLSQQQLIDPQRVFGPIAPLVMEEVFKGNRERQARFRARTSSANWNGSDRLTETERRRDQEARERLERDGGWTFNPGM